MIKFLLVTDLHYCYKNEPIERRHSLSLQKLKDILNEHAHECDFIVNLGDTSDSLPDCGDQVALMSEINEEFKKTNLPYYCAIGNHDTATPKQTIIKTLNMPDRYYSFQTEDYTCIVLDANMNDPKLPYPENEIIWTQTYLDKEQLDFMEETINNSEKPVLIFSHELFMLQNFDEPNRHVILNRDDAVTIFEKSDKVKAVFCGHYHYGDNSIHNGIHYTTFNSLCVNEDKTCAVVTIDNSKVTIQGYGLQPSYEYYLR